MTRTIGWSRKKMKNPSNAVSGAVTGAHASPPTAGASRVTAVALPAPTTVLRRAVAAALAVATTFGATEARSDAPRPVTPVADAGGFASVYGQLPPDQAEFLSTAEAIKSAAATNGAPSLVWEVLEHGEKVECLDCIPLVGRLIYASDPRTREIAAWWLRRRVFGVFGAGEVYSQTVQTLKSDPDPVRRSYAAYALGEFFVSPGVTACAQALSDPDARVRAAAASALGRLNSDGLGALAGALSDPDPGVKLAALASAVRVNSFTGIASVTALVMDASPEVRRRALETLDALDATDAVAVVAAAAQNDNDAAVRAEACHALGTFRNASVMAVLVARQASDPDPFVRDQAQIALRRL